MYLNESESLGHVFMFESHPKSNAVDGIAKRHRPLAVVPGIRRDVASIGLLTLLVQVIADEIAESGLVSGRGNLAAQGLRVPAQKQRPELAHRIESE